jgi:hypothetical protein
MVGRQWARSSISRGFRAGRGLILRRLMANTSTVGVVSTDIQFGGISRTLVSIRDLSHYEKYSDQLRQARRWTRFGSLAGGVGA